MASELIINGTPLAEFAFDGLPSWNVVIRKHRMQQSAMTKVLRKEGFTLAQQFMRRFFAGQEYMLSDLGVKADDGYQARALVVVKVQPPHEGVLDIYNVDIKDVCDGFTDAMVWPDDEWAWLPVTVFMWAPAVNAPESRTTIEIHDLGRVVINGKSQPLPKGRRRVQE